MTGNKKGVITARDEFLFPDQECGDMPECLGLAMAKNGKPGIQVLVHSGGGQMDVSISGDMFEAEWYQMISVPVEYNTGDGQEQGGAMVILADEKPDYAVRKAPFQVYDCLRPLPNGRVDVVDGVGALYLCLVPKEGILPGNYELSLDVDTAEGHHRCKLQVHVYDVEIPEGNFKVTNWFSLESISRFHQVEPQTPEFLAMVRKYAAAMRRVRQTMFYLELDQRCVVSRDPWKFDFSYLESLIRIFFDEGMEKLEIGPILSRGFLEDGMPDMYTSAFRCAMAPDVDFDSLEGYRITSVFIKSLAEFLKCHGWEKRVVFHIHDEPDVHVRDEAGMEARKRQYFQTAAILKKYIPEARVIEAVKTTEFRGGVDIWVPVTSSFEEQKEEFLQMMDLGEEVWNYVCCVPEGGWLNRFLDDAVIHSRLMFWGFEKYGISGYLHWGFNVFQMGLNPFAGTSCPNHTGIGTNFPCGDAFIVYPGTDGPWIGMRLEEQRRGVEDAELLRCLREVNPARHDELVNRLFTSNCDYVDDPDVFAEVYEEVLRELEKKS